MALVLTEIAATSAPADQYFGRFKISALRIRYEIPQIKKRYETHELTSEQAEHLMLLTEDALHQWAHLYPKDPWLPSTAYNMAGVYEELAGSTARDHAVALFVYVKSHFPTTSYARESRDALHRGVFTKPQPASTVAPAAAPSPSLTPSPTPSLTPSAAPSGSATPPPRPSAPPVKGGAFGPEHRRLYDD
ncbi:MAG TPA: hypothetical protein VFE16_14290 [Candidatus Cybelea sp.]|nr:hypothetical protein [Candidatus Cybelea sp.]